MQLANPGVSPDVSPELIAEDPADRRPRRPRRGAARRVDDRGCPRSTARSARTSSTTPGHHRCSTAAPTSRSPAPTVPTWRGGSTRTTLLGEAPDRRRRVPAPTRSRSAGITYDEMRPGCYEPQARLDDMDVNWRRGVALLPDLPALLRARSSSRRRTRSSPSSCVDAYNDWMVEEWCGDSGGRLIPLCLIPLWDAELAAAEVRRNAARGVQRGRASARSRRTSGCRASTPATGTRSSRRARRPAPSSACTSARARRCRRRRPTRPTRCAATLIFGNAMREPRRLPVLRRARALPRR